MVLNLVNKIIIPGILSLKKKIIKYDKYKEQYLGYVSALVKKGLKIGKNVTIESTVSIDGVYPYLISIGDNCSIAANTILLAHDDTTVKFTGGYARLGKIEIKDNCFIGTNSIILPGVTIGPNVLVAAGSVVNKDIPPNSCVAGVPARFYAKFNELIENTKGLIESHPCFSYQDLHAEKVNDKLKAEVVKATEEGVCFVKGKPPSKEVYILWNPE